MRVSLAVIVLFVLTLYFKSCVSAGNNEVDDKKEPNKYAPLWFGPRIGRKKRNLVDEGYKNFDKEEVEVLLEFIRKSPWTIMLFGNGKRLINYNPKDEHGISEDDEFTEMEQRSMFAPRLGRSAFYPRLGRGNSILE
ncbi:unnamed protein product [Psylliodes chrysocephalus]|uniref:Uncharacterized protein n=1 Tax=Psylliodes chrysocephalus TaxID=3402493 RepID=A0A9P0CUU9_9CUCU|nr:unnamed protein product [Psylliodes chrysocephala]